MATTQTVSCLIVDDLEENLVALAALLQSSGVQLLRARSGPEALELLLKHEIALALLDIQMPGMDGFELAELMRGTDRTRRVPIIFLTAGTADRYRQFKGYGAGAVDFLQKPIEPDILRSKAEVFFELYRHRQEVAQQRDELQIATADNLRLLEQSRSHVAALEEADRRKNEFLAVLAHELRNPLGPVRNAVEILRHSSDDDPTMRESREIISRQISHMSRLIDDLLDVNRIGMGKVTLRKEPCDLSSIVRATAEDYAKHFEHTQVEFQVHVESPLPVRGDRTRLAQIIGNLLHNASKFTPSGGRVTIQASMRDGKGVVEVRDNGVGMEPSILSRVFEPFSQAEQTPDRSFGGLGLGLALANGLAKLHDGSIQVLSEGVGKGASFTVEIPLAAAAASPKPNEAEHRAGAAVNASVLIVEDNQDAARSLQLLLKLLGCQATVAADGASAVEAARLLKPSVILSDLGLPGRIDGYELVRILRQEECCKEAKIVAISGYGQAHDVLRSTEAGFDQHLVKPVELKQLRELLGI